MRGRDVSPVERDRAGARPEVLLNCAVSMDGRLAYAGGTRARLSSEEDLRRVHQLRADVDAIVVGIGTVLQDDPSLRVRWELLDRPAGKAPIRVVLDSHGRTPSNARILGAETPTIVAVVEGTTPRFPPHVRTIVAGRDRVDLGRLLHALAAEGVHRVLVEGGAAVLASFVRAGLFDRWTVYYAPLVIGGTTAPSMISGPDTASRDGAETLQLVGVERLGEGVVATFVPARREPG